MKRSDILKLIKKQLESIGSTPPIFEVYIHPGNFKEISVERTLLIEGNTTKDNIIKLFNTYYTTTIQEDSIAQYETLDAILSSNLIGDSHFEQSLNWRGRLYKWDNLASISNKKEFDDKVLASYWRLIVTQNEDDYFTRHEISPTYYNPGHSTGGLKDFRDGIQSFFKYLSKLRDRWQIDPTFDRIVIFARLEPTKKFTRCIPDFFDGNNYINFDSLIKEINKKGQDPIIDDIYASIKKELR